MKLERGDKSPETFLMLQDDRRMNHNTTQTPVHGRPLGGLSLLCTEYAKANLTCMFFRASRYLGKLVSEDPQ